MAHRKESQPLTPVPSANVEKFDATVDSLADNALGVDPQSHAIMTSIGKGLFPLASMGIQIAGWVENCLTKRQNS